MNESTTTELSPDPISERSEADKIVDGMDFGQLCNEFECISSPLVESTARQLVRDILELRQRDRSLGIYAVFVKYKVCSLYSYWWGFHIGNYKCLVLSQHIKIY